MMSPETTIAIIFLEFLVVLLVLSLIYVIPVVKGVRKYGRNDFLFSANFPFSGGLNLPSGAKCLVSCLKSRVVFSANGQEFNLPSDRIIDVSVMKTSDIQKQYVSSVGGAVAGALLLGPIGAVLGGAATQRSIKTNKKYLIFSYKDSEDIKYILFDVSSKSSQANKFVKKFRSLRKNEAIKVEL